MDSYNYRPLAPLVEYFLESVQKPLNIYATNPSDMEVGKNGIKSYGMPY